MAAADISPRALILRERHEARLLRLHISVHI